MGKGNRGMNYKKELRRYQPYLDYIKEYSCSLNAASGSKVDANANVENKNVTTLTGELYKKDGIGINRLRMYQKLAEMFGEEYAERYIDQLENHEIYKHDETNPLLPYCVSITMYPFLFDGLRNLGGGSGAPHNLDSFAGSFINLCFAIASQFAGAVSTPEFLSYMDYFVRKEYGDDYYHSFFNYHSSSVDSLASCCRLRNELQDNTFSFTLGAGGVSTGSKCVITINMNRLIQNAVRNDKDIKVALSGQVDDVHKYLLAYDALLQDSFNAKLLPVYDAGYISLEKQFLTIGINGLVEGAEYLGYSISPDDNEYCNFVNELLSVIYQKNKAARTSDVMFNTEYVPAENLGVKNSKWDKEDGYFSPRECYNSYFYLVDDVDTTPIDKFILHGKTMTGNLDGGAALHLNLDEHLSKEQYKHLMKVAIKTGCSYWTVNVPNTICNDCGHISKHHLDHCEKCGSKNIDYATRVIGYLKRVSNFSEARQKEAKKRYYAKA